MLLCYKMSQKTYDLRCLAKFVMNRRTASGAVSRPIAVLR
ncbi:MAG: hypothetical protein UW34_C0004G0010 [Parcubacteria group bacterium GW2011_GWA2_44_15]|nr:MAG: hypothetical protein UW34_C0004G0010 [Parcubacteria group bacterium GW2011_GWA2_44_15]